MLYIDGFALERIKDELKQNLKNKRISKLYQTDKFSLSIYFGKQKLVLSANPNMPIAYLSTKKEENPNSQPLFGLTLRKFLLNSNLDDILQFNYDRILIFKFSKINELGNTINSNLILELMGKHSNIILTNEDYLITDVLKRFSIEENRLRTLIPGVKYEFPIIKNKISPKSVDDNLLKSLNTEKEIINKIDGIGKFSAKNILLLKENYDEFLNKKTHPNILYANSNAKYGFIFDYLLNDFDIENLEKKYFDTISEMVEEYIFNTINSNQFNNLYKTIEKKVDSAIVKNSKILKSIDSVIKKNVDYDKFKEIGDILAANLHSIRLGMKSVELFDFYNNLDINIELKSNVSPQENLKRYYNKFSKLKRGYNYNIERKKVIENEIDYLLSVLNSIENAKDIADLKFIQEELIENNYIKKSVNKKRKKIKKLPIENAVLKFSIDDNYEILVGKNNKANDYLTFKIASKNDIWLHAKNIPGSHVIIKSKNFELSEDIILKAASLAAYYSRGKENSKVNVDYTYRKYVKKPNGSKPGFVIYTNEHSVNISPSNTI
ncbi:Rqc2 family fibronectin-binding protein [Haliovirga abyssi]|uniref:Rqc2 homolog RqcH n=1 Tax=Haliovirga abyssi TaxID=2996794 RepID=A0AAU9DDJ9_9FUSO|nr:NFACT family protein [Haliovirga abyssi]BDU50243.1 hypothetical protein HLVA_08120 [Haliovirga abyssi]